MKRLSSCPVHCTTVTISHVLPALLPVLMNQAPLIADFTLFGPIVSLHRRGFDSSDQAQGEGGGQEGVGSISSKKTCQQNKILTNDSKAGELPPTRRSRAGQRSFLSRCTDTPTRSAFRFIITRRCQHYQSHQIDFRCTGNQELRLSSLIVALYMTIQPHE